MHLKLLSTATIVVSLGITACSGTETAGSLGVGGQTPGTGGSNTVGNTGGQSAAILQTGGAYASGGANAGIGGSASGVGGAATGGAVATGGLPAITGGATGTGGNPAVTGGASALGGSTAATGGKATGGSTTATGGKATGGSMAATGGKATGGAATGGATATGGKATGGAATGGGSSTGLANFSFFVASEASLISLSGNAKGFGGDLRYNQTTGLAGADKICAALAELSMPGSSAKQWRAFLSIAANGSETAVNAIDRVGAGPWYDRLGRVVSLTKAGLAADRPTGANTAIINDLPNEYGTPNHSPSGTQVDNHDTLTGSTSAGLLASTYANTCNNWTSAVSATGKPVIGHSWSASSGTNWIQVGHTGGGCAPGASPATGAQQGESGTVGSMGGYGGFYCFALSP